MRRPPKDMYARLIQPCQFAHSITVAVYWFLRSLGGDTAREATEQRGGLDVQSLSLNTILESVDLAIAHVIVHVGKRGFAAHVPPPPLLVVAVAVERKCCGENDLQVLADETREQVDVDVERHLCLVVRRTRREAPDTVVLGLVKVRYGERVLEELRIARRHFRVWMGSSVYARESERDGKRPRWYVDRSRLEQGLR